MFALAGEVLDDLGQKKEITKVEKTHFILCFNFKLYMLLRCDTFLRA